MQTHLPITEKKEKEWKQKKYKKKGRQEAKKPNPCVQHKENKFSKKT